MMKSIFLAESKMLEMNNNGTSNDNDTGDNEYIMVDSTPLSFESCFEDDHEESTLCDDEDYDYCDDVISEGVQSECLNLTEDMILEEAEKPSIQHILDEAHRSASQLVSMDDPIIETDVTAAPVPGVLESSASDASAMSAPQPTEEKTRKDIPMEISTSDPPCPPTSGPTEANLADQDPLKSLTPSKPPTMTLSNAAALMEQQLRADPSESASLAPVGGRMSNKKRRKKMKLMKKAAAAAMAAAALSEASSVAVKSNAPSRTRSGKSSTKAGTTSRYNKKRVANIAAVACATETLASYKAEVASSSKKFR